MKLLGWMHRKLRQSNNDVFKEFNIGGGGNCNCLNSLPLPDSNTFHATTTEYFTNNVSTTNHSSPPITSADLFTFSGSGLLTIGTLGIAAFAIPGDDNDTDNDTIDANDGAITPTFGFPPPAAEVTMEKAIAKVEAIAEKDDDTTTEDDLMVVSAELEKVLGGAGSDVAVASARVSFAMGIDCPLQGFLFGSPMSDTGSQSEQKEGGRRASLGELFMRTRFAEEKVSLVSVAEIEDGGSSTSGGEREDGKGGKGGGYHKMLKKRKVKDDKGGKGNGGGALGNGMVNKSKFQKILQIFHRKVYPESAVLTRNPTKKNRKRGAPDNDHNGNSGEQGRTSDAKADESMVSPKIRCKKERMPSLSCCTKCAVFSPEKSELNGDKSGYWIKTDADYLVLEL